MLTCETTPREVALKYSLSKKINHSSVFIDIESRTFTALRDQEWAWKSMKCPGCASVDTRWHPRPVDVRLAEPPARGMGGLVVAGLSLFSLRLFDQVRSHCRDIVFGSVLVDSGQRVLEAYQTVYSTDPVLIRSSPPKRLFPEYSTCNVCNRSMCTPLQPPKCILDRDVGSRRVLMSRSGHLFIEEQLVRELDWTGMSDATGQPVYVVD